MNLKILKDLKVCSECITSGKCVEYLNGSVQYPLHKFYKE
jgi:hypothetical protein